MEKGGPSGSTGVSGSRKREKSQLIFLQMQRIIQMNVIPDLIPRCTPTIDLAVSFGESPVATGGEPGAYLLPSQVMSGQYGSAAESYALHSDNTSAEHQAAGV